MSRLIRIRNLSNPNQQPVTLRLCETFTSRLRGLMLRPHLGRHEGLLLVESRETRMGAAIHMLFMRFALAVIWLDQERRVVDKAVAEPWRPAYLPRAPARYIMEIHPARWDDYEIGDQLGFEQA